MSFYLFKLHYFLPHERCEVIFQVTPWLISPPPPLHYSPSIDLTKFTREKNWFILVFIMLVIMKKSETVKGRKREKKNEKSENQTEKDRKESIVFIDRSSNGSE